MANYTSHAIMSELLFNKLKKKKKFKVDVNKDNMKLFSLGQDLTFLNINCFHNTHSINSKRFFVDTIKYIKTNNLEYNEEVMAYLYGHIAHYALDINVHKFIKETIVDVDKVFFLKPHTILECNIDIYLVKKYDNNYNYLTIKNFNSNKVKEMINNTYTNVYGYFFTSKTYLKTIIFIKSINGFVNTFYKSKKIFHLLTKKEKYINSYFYNCLNNNDLFNKKTDKLLNESIKKAELMIKYTNKYLYNKPKDLYLNLVFNNTPYNGKKISENEFIFNKKLPLFNEIKIK
ncbi:MAG TPA: zinc dependent phospholipase C family protein [Bacilli bacterium]|nr:zinc dependent phospholipase C family protein [Bacilli bacterium]